MSNWRKLAWEVEQNPPDVGDRVVAQSTSDPTITATGVVVRRIDGIKPSSDMYVIRMDDGTVIPAFANQVRFASSWEVSPYKFQIGQQVKVLDFEGGFIGTIELAARDSHNSFYVVRDDMGEPHVIDEEDIEAIPEGEI